MMRRDGLFSLYVEVVVFKWQFSAEGFDVRWMNERMGIQDIISFSGMKL